MKPGRAGPLSDRQLGVLLVVCGAIALVAAFVLLVEKIELLVDPNYVPSCSINPVLSCGSIMKTWQAEAFGFPNPMIGIAGFAVVVTTGAVLVGRAVLPRWYWMGLQCGVTFGVLFIHWLIFQSLYRIDALCPYCMVVWASMIPIFWYTTLRNLASAAPTRAPVPTLVTYHGAILTLWYLVIIAAITARFWDYWSTLLP